MKIFVLCALISYCLAEAPLATNNNFNGYAAAGYKPQGPEFRLPTDTSATEIEISEENLEYAGQLGENLPEDRQAPNNQYLPPANNNVEDDLEGEEVLSEDALRVQALPKEDAPTDFNQNDQYRTFVPPQGRARLRQQARANFRNTATRSQKLIAPVRRQKTAKLQKAKPQQKRQQLRARPQPKRQQLRQQPKRQQLRARTQKTAQFRQQKQQFTQQQFFPQQQQRFVQRPQQFAQIRQQTTGRKTQQLRARPAKLQRIQFARQEQAPTDFGDNSPANPAVQYGAPAVEYGVPNVETIVETAIPANSYGVPAVDTKDVNNDEPQAEEPEQEAEDEVEPEAEQEDAPEAEQGQDGEQEQDEEKDVEQEDVAQEEEQEQSDEEDDDETQEDEEDSQEQDDEEVQNPDSEPINTDEETAVSISNAVSQQANGQYFIVTPDNTLQRVRFSTKQTAADKRNNGFTAQLRYSPVQSIKDPIYAYNGQGQLVRIFKK